MQNHKNRTHFERNTSNGHANSAWHLLCLTSNSLRYDPRERGKRKRGATGERLREEEKIGIRERERGGGRGGRHSLIRNEALLQNDDKKPCEAEEGRGEEGREKREKIKCTENECVYRAMIARTANRYHSWSANRNE